MKTRTVGNGGMSIVLDNVKDTDRHVDGARGKAPDFPVISLLRLHVANLANRTPFPLDRLVSCTIDT
jgi:hypothetical protein